MFAWQVPAPGAQPVLETVPVPTPLPGTVLVKIMAVGLNPLDNVLASGVMAEVIPHQYPMILGRDAAGVVEALGEGVEHVAVGDDVVGHVLLSPPLQRGTLAQFALLHAETVVRKPRELAYETAAALPLAGTAALLTVDAVEAQAGQTVLVVGASGGVGSYVVQLLTARGVTVLATGTAADAERLLKLGAQAAIDFTAAPVAEQVRRARPEGVDALIDLVAPTPQDMPLSAVRTGGRVVSTLGAADPEALAVAHLTGGNIMAAPDRVTIGRLLTDAAGGGLTVDIGEVLPFAEAHRGLATLAGGSASGKLVVRVEH